MREHEAGSETRRSFAEAVETERLVLRPLAERDRAEFVRAHGISADFHRPWLPTRAGSLDTIFEREIDRNRSGRYVRCVAVLPDGHFAGFFNLNRILRGAYQSAFASWAVSADAAGRGYATEAVRALLDLAFSRADGLGLHRVQADILPHNERSLRLAERLGMRREGLQKRYLEIDGRWQDHWMYAKTAEEHVLTYLR